MSLNQDTFVQFLAMFLLWKPHSDSSVIKCFSQSWQNDRWPKFWNEISGFYWHCWPLNLVLTNTIYSSIYCWWFYIYLHAKLGNLLMIGSKNKWKTGPVPKRAHRWMSNKDMCHFVKHSLEVKDRYFWYFVFPVLSMDLG